MSSKICILIIEDEAAIRNFMTTALSGAGYKVITAKDGQQGLVMTTSYRPDVVLLDLGLPDMDGMKIIRSIREWSLMPIIVVSARGMEDDKVEALDAGADDYLTKPFSVDELLARIRAAQRRISYLSGRNEESPVFINGDLSIDYTSNIVRISENEIHLTAIEYRLLTLLAANVGKVLTHSYLIDRIWGSGIESDIVSLRVYMTSLRKKLRTSETQEDMIRTHIGIGYQMIRI